MINQLEGMIRFLLVEEWRKFAVDAGATIFLIMGLQVVSFGFGLILYLSLFL